MTSRAGIPVLFLLSLIVQSAAADDKPTEKPGDLDVTMQIIVDADGKLPDAIVRRIPLPSAARKTGERPTPAARDEAESSSKGESRRPVDPGEAQEQGREFGEEVAERAREMAEEAAEQHEEAGRSIAEEARRNRGPPVDPPDPPPVPPGPP